MLFERVPQLVDAEQLRTDFLAEVQCLDGESIFYTGEAGDYLVRDADTGAILGIMDEAAFEDLYDVVECVCNCNCDDYECCQECCECCVEDNTSIEVTSSVKATDVTIQGNLKVEGQPDYAELAETVRKVCEELEKNKQPLKTKQPLQPYNPFPNYPIQPNYPIFPSNPTWPNFVGDRPYWTGTQIICDGTNYAGTDFTKVGGVTATPVASYIVAKF